jgi:hypothetical protein
MPGFGMSPKDTAMTTTAAAHGAAPASGLTPGN